MPNRAGLLRKIIDERERHDRPYQHRQHNPPEGIVSSSLELLWVGADVRESLFDIGLWSAVLGWERVLPVGREIDDIFRHRNTIVGHRARRAPLKRSRGVPKS
jgi:hypothetical protein